MSLPEYLCNEQQPLEPGETLSKEPITQTPATPTSEPPGLPVLHFITLHTPCGGAGGRKRKGGAHAGWCPPLISPDALELEANCQYSL